MVKKVTFKDGEQKTTPTEIKWKDGKDLTANNKRKKDEEASESFFTIFKQDDVTLLDYIANDLFAEAVQ